MNKVIRCGILSGLAEEENRLEKLKVETDTQINKLRVKGKHLATEITSIRCMLEHLSSTEDKL